MKNKNLIIKSILGAIILLSNVSAYFIGKSNSRKFAIDLSITEEGKESEHKYQFLDKTLSAYITSLSLELEIDPDLVVAILMCENPEFNPEATHKN